MILNQTPRDAIVYLDDGSSRSYAHEFNEMIKMIATSPHPSGVYYCRIARRRGESFILLFRVHQNVITGFQFSVFLCDQHQMKEGHAYFSAGDVRTNLFDGFLRGAEISWDRICSTPDRKGIYFNFMSEHGLEKWVANVTSDDYLRVRPLVLN